MPGAKTKFTVNPYLFILLKRMLEYEIVGPGGHITKRQIAEYVYARNKRADWKNSNFNSPEIIRDKAAYTLADGIRIELFSSKNFYFSVEKLDQLAQQICIIDTFPNWQSFVSEYESDAGAHEAQIRYSNGPFDDLSSEIQDKIKGLVEKRLSFIHLRLLREGHGNFIVQSNDQFTLRSMTKVEFREQCKLYIKEGLPPNLYQQNSRMGWVLLDDIRNIGVLILFPIIEHALLRIKQGNLKEHQLQESDIFGPDNTKEITHIHIGAFWVKNRAHATLLLKQIQKILEILCFELNEKAIVSVLTKSIFEGSTQMLGGYPLWDFCQFESSTLISVNKEDPNIQNCFLEISLGNFINQLNQLFN